VTSPYTDKSQEEWAAITRDLIAKHPLKLEDIRDIALETWDVLWSTTIGSGATSIPLKDVDPPATVVGYFFEKLLARALAARFPSKWRGCQSKDEKDLVYVPDPRASIEVKSSGQLGLKIFGNRSYGQVATELGRVTKADKSGYFLTINFYGQTLNLLRFGWIDHSDWKPQKSQTGQASGLPDEVYQYKLIEIGGEYRYRAPIALLPGIGGKKIEQLADLGVRTIGDLFRYNGAEGVVLKAKKVAEDAFKRDRAANSEQGSLL
jgi:hypothetical protein